MLFLQGTRSLPGLARLSNGPRDACPLGRKVSPASVSGDKLGLHGIGLQQAGFRAVKV